MNPQDDIISVREIRSSGGMVDAHALGACVTWRESSNLSLSMV